MSAAPTARSLFAAAREDGPTAEERDALFQQIALATGAGLAAGVATATAAATTTTAKAASTAVGMKLVALVGAVSITLGVMIALTVHAPDAPRPTDASASASARAPALVERQARSHAATRGARLASGASRRRDPSMDERRAEAPSASVAAPRAPDPISDLAEEARLVTEARAALMAGDPSRALTLLQATRKLSARALEPEELGLEARALHALGRADDAAATELVLRRRHPDHALAR